jgi:BON domain
LIVLVDVFLLGGDWEYSRWRSHFRTEDYQCQQHISAVWKACACRICWFESHRRRNVHETAIRKSLDQAGLKDVSVGQDRDKAVVTLGGHVPSDVDKSQAESIAKSIAGVQVVSNQIGVIPPATESQAKTVNSDLDKGIERNLDAALIGFTRVLNMM